TPTASAKAERLCPERASSSARRSRKSSASLRLSIGDLRGFVGVPFVDFPQHAQGALHTNNVRCALSPCVASRQLTASCQEQGWGIGRSGRRREAPAGFRVAGYAAGR